MSLDNPFLIKVLKQSFTNQQTLQGSKIPFNKLHDKGDIDGKRKLRPFSCYQFFLNQL